MSTTVIGQRSGGAFTRRAALQLGMCCATGFTAGCAGQAGSPSESECEPLSDRCRQPSTGTPRDGPPDTSSLELVFEDSFGGGSLDAAKWRDKYPWNARTHNYDGYAAPENAFVEDGILRLEAENESRGGKQYTTGVVSAKQVFEPPGYFEARVKTPPRNPGFWPAFWLTSASQWPPEMDVFEFEGTDPRVLMTYYFTSGGGEERRVRGTYDGPEFSEDYHTFGLEWVPDDRLVWYIDGRERFRYVGETVRGEYCWLILNFGIAPSFLDNPDPETLPATFDIDYVRCWREPPETTETTGASLTAGVSR